MAQEDDEGYSPLTHSGDGGPADSNLVEPSVDNLADEIGFASPVCFSDPQLPLRSRYTLMATIIEFFDDHWYFDKQPTFVIVRAATEDDEPIAPSASSELWPERTKLTMQDQDPDAPIESMTLFRARDFDVATPWVHELRARLNFKPTQTSTSTTRFPKPGQVIAVAYYPGPDNLVLGEKLELTLKSPESLVRALGAVSLLISCVVQPELKSDLFPQLRALVDDPEAIVRIVAIICAMAIDGSAADLLPNVIRMLSKTDEIQPALESLVPDTVAEEFLASIVDRLLPRTNDPEFNDFVRLFIHFAFHPGTRDTVHTIVAHPWYRRIQSSRLNAVCKDRRSSDLLDDAAQEFAARLIQDPTLGMKPEKWAELAGYVRNHAGDVAKLIFRRQVRNPSPANLDFEGRLPLTTSGRDPSAQAALNEVSEIFSRLLSDVEKNVVMQWMVKGQTLAETATALGLSVSQVRTNIEGILRKLAERIQIPNDRELLLTLAESLAANPSSGLSPRPKTE